MPKKLEKGAASLVVSFVGGQLTVRHGTEDMVLLTRELYEGEWNRIWDALHGERTT